MVKAFHVRLPRTTYSSGRSLYEQARLGLKPIVDSITAFVDSLEERVLPEVMQEALEPTLELSNHYAPVDTGAMRESAYVEVKGRKNPRAEIGYNRHGEAPYTIFVHEMPQFYHDPPTQYKFLQRAMDEDQENIMARITTGIKSSTGL